jgi:hypothetical protein
VRVPSIQLELAEAQAELLELMERRRSAPLGDPLLLDGLDRSIDLKRERMRRMRESQRMLQRARLAAAVGE